MMLALGCNVAATVTPSDTVPPDIDHFSNLTLSRSKQDPLKWHTAETASLLEDLNDICSNDIAVDVMS